MLAERDAAYVRHAYVGSEDGRVELEHRGFDRHGEGGDGYEAALASEQGWPFMLGRYVERVSR